MAIELDETLGGKLCDVVSVTFPSEDQAVVFNRELRLAIYNARKFPKGNRMLEGVWLGLHSIGAITESQYRNLIVAYCNIRHSDDWAAMDDNTIIKHCGGIVPG